MGWRDQFRPGSFRGVPFVTVEHEAELGRRGQSDEFPDRDEPYREDLGRAARRWRVSAFVIGRDYMAARDALMAAIEAKGPGMLVHPWLGSFLASVDSCRVSESTAEGGMARFDLAFVEPGAALTAAVAPDTSEALAAAADAGDASAASRLAARTRPARPGFIDAQTAAVIARIADVARLAGMGLGGAGQSLRAFQSGLVLLGGASLLIGAPAQLASAMLGLVGAIGRLGGTSWARVSALAGLIDAAEALPPVPATTPSRAIAAGDQQAIADLVILAAAGACARVAAETAFGSYDEAVAFRDALADRLDAAALAAADRGNGALAADLDGLRRAVIADVTARGGSLERLFAYDNRQPTPALVLAWRLYRDPAATLAQAGDLVTRNRVRHPGFVPAGPVQALTASAPR